MDEKAAVAVNPVAMKLPPLTLKNPSLWFRRAEAKFRLAGITSQTTMADHALNALSEDALERLDTWLDQQDIKLDYKDLKQYVVKRFSPSASERAQRILQMADQPLGDTTVQEAYDEIEALARLPTEEGKDPQRVSLEREILLQRLPRQIRQALPDAHSMEKDDLVDKADKLLQSFKATGGMVSNAHVEADAVLPRHKKTLRLSPKVPQNDDLCYYHSRFGDDANKCRAGCSKWPKNAAAGRQ